MAPQLRSRELQDASRRSQPIADSALFAGARGVIQRVEGENERLRADNARLTIDLADALETAACLDRAVSWMDGAA
jgi:hypothetical protein